jgi:catechol 2,3-dioxygenase-like lactoylglutathione lyase family enzyme
MNAEHIGIYAHDTTCLSQWYTNTLGFRVIRTLEKEGRPPIFFLQSEDGMVIEILPTAKPPVSRELNEPGYSHIGLLVADFAQASASLEEKGVALFDVRQTTNGWTIGYFNDPEGNRLELVYRP